MDSLVHDLLGKVNGESSGPIDDPRSQQQQLNWNRKSKPEQAASPILDGAQISTPRSAKGDFNFNGADQFSDSGSQVSDLFVKRVETFTPHTESSFISTGT